MHCDVFISYDGTDAVHCDRLRHTLEHELRLSVFADRMDLEPEPGATPAVGDRLRGRGATFVVMTASARDRAWVARAVELASERHHRVVPVVFDDEGARLAITDPGLRSQRFLDGRRSDEDLVFALWRCLYASLTTAA